MFSMIISFSVLMELRQDEIGSYLMGGPFTWKAKKVELLRAFQLPRK